MKEKKEKKKLNLGGVSVRNWVGYSLGDMGGCMTFALMGSIVTRYYTNVLHVDAVLMATILLVWNVWDAVNDPIMGVIMDRAFAKNKDPNGKFRPWILRSTPLLAVSFIVFWTVPTFFEGTTMLVVLFVTKLIYEAFYTMFNIPMGSLLSAMADTDEQRASLSSARGFGSGVGGALPVAILPLLLKKYGDTPKAFFFGSVICAGIGFFMCLGHYYMTEEKHVVESTDADNIKVSDLLEVFRHNRPFVALCLHGVCICTMQYVSNTLSTYMYSDVLGDIGLMSTSTVLSFPAMGLIFVLAPAISKRMGLIPFIRGSLLTGFFLYLGLFAAHLIGNVNPYVHLIWSSVAAGVGMVSIMMQWGLVGEAIDYNEFITGKRTEGSIYGTFNLTRRIGQTVGSSLGILALSWVGYDSMIPVQSTATVQGIKFLCVMLPGIFLLGSWAAFKYIWNISPEEQQKVKEFKEAQNG